MPNLENLKKRAKTLVKQHHAGLFPVAARLRKGVTRFAALSDAEILAAPFALIDALDTVAREEGLAGWTELAGQTAPSSPRPRGRETTEPTEPQLVAAYPQVLVADVSRAAAFYRDALGFDVAYLYGEPPFYGLVARGGARLNLRHVDDPARYRGIAGGAASDPDVLTANIPVHGVKALFLELRARQVDFARTLVEQPWGASDFVVRDPDGNLLCFASAV